MKDTLEGVRKALNVHKIIILTIIGVVLISCAAHRPDKVDSTYTLKKYRSKSGFSSIVLYAYDFHLKNKMTANVSVNDVYFYIDYKNKQIHPLKIKTIPSRKYNVEVSSIGMNTVKIKDLYVEKGDSIVINAFLKEDKTPLH